MLGLCCMDCILILYLWLLHLGDETRAGARGIEKKGWAGKKRYLGAAIGFLIVYLPVFWDWLPTVAECTSFTARRILGFGFIKLSTSGRQRIQEVIEGLPAPSSTR